MKRIATFLARNIGFIAAALVALYLVVHVVDPPRLNWGDSGSDYHVMTAGWNFAHYGFLNMRLTPHLLDAALITPSEGSFIYTHYPQLPDLMNGLERRLGLSTLPQFRVVSLLFALASLFFFFRLVERYWDRATAQIALALWVTNPLWIQHADYLHHIPYLLFFGLGSLYFLDRYLVEGRRGPIFASGAFLFLTFLSSYDYWFFAPILVALMAYRRSEGSLTATLRVLIPLGVCAFAAVAFKVGTNVWARGGWQPFLGDLRFQYLERATPTITRVDSASAAGPTMLGRIERYFSLLFYPIAIYWAVVPWLRRRKDTRWSWLEPATPNPWWLALAALPFLWIFMEMWIGQAYPAMLILPFVVVSAGDLAARLLRADRPIIRAVGAAAVVALIGNSLAENSAFDKAFLTDRTIASLQADLDRVSVPGQYVLGNHIFDGFYRYYFRRNLIAMELNPPERMPAALTFYTNPRNVRLIGPDGVVFVQHKQLAAQLYDKGIYYMLSQRAAWDAWGNPPKFKRGIDEAVQERDSVLMALVAARGRRVADTPEYAIWTLPPDSTARLASAPKQ